jgi:hypothetical protein
MTVTNWITVGGILVAAIIALIVADQNRKQMRQLEAHRIDPSVGLTPPPHPVFVFLRKHWTALCAGGYGLYLLLHQYRVNNMFISRGEVFSTVIGVCLLFFAAMLTVVQEISEEVKRIVRMERRDEKQIEAETPKK